MKATQVIIYGLFQAVFFVFISCSSGPEEPAGKPNPGSDSLSHEVSFSKEQLTNAGITTGKAQLRSVSKQVSANGFLDVPPQNLVSVYARASGYVTSVSILQGMHVHKGDPLCVLENQEFISMQQEYMSNAGKLKYLESEYQRQTDLAKENIASSKAAQQSESDLNALKYVQKGLEARLKIMGFSLEGIRKGNFSSELVVRSPIDGYVTKVEVNLGKSLQPSDLVCEIVNLDHIHAELRVFEQDISGLEAGQSLEFSVTGNPSKKYKASIYLINKKIDADRTIQVHAHIEEDVPMLLPNMQIIARIRTHEKKVWTVPSEALVTLGGKTVVFYKGTKPGHFIALPVGTGEKEDDFVEIQLPPSADPNTMEFVLTGAYDLKSFLENTGEED